MATTSSTSDIGTSEDPLCFLTIRVWSWGWTRSLFSLVKKKPVLTHLQGMYLVLGGGGGGGGGGDT